MKTLIVYLIFLSQSALANNGQGTMGGSQVGTLMVHGFVGGTGGGGILLVNSKGTDNSRVGTL